MFKFKGVKIVEEKALGTRLAREEGGRGGSMRVFETRTVTGSELFSLLTCPDTTTFILLRIFSPLETGV